MNRGTYYLRPRLQIISYLVLNHRDSTPLTLAFLIQPHIFQTYLYSNQSVYALKEIIPRTYGQLSTRFVAFIMQKKSRFFSLIWQQ